MTNPFYKSAKWERKRAAILKRDEYLCQECKRYNKSTEANVVHHIFPLEQYPEYALENWNLISLCHQCHECMHERYTGKLSPLGMQWVDRVSLKYGIDKKKLFKTANGYSVYLVWGSPASGKTTYVKKHRRDEDMVIDLDLIKQSISMQGKTNTGEHLLPVALSIREHLYNMVEHREIPCNVWVVAGLPRLADRARLIKRLKPDEVLFMNVPKEECIQRALNDNERADKELQIRIINKWFNEFEPDPPSLYL